MQTQVKKPIYRKNYYRSPKQISRQQRIVMISRHYLESNVLPKCQCLTHKRIFSKLRTIQKEFIQTEYLKEHPGGTNLKKDKLDAGDETITQFIKFLCSRIN